MIFMLAATDFADVAGGELYESQIIPVVKDTIDKHPPDAHKAKDSLPILKENSYFYFLMYS